MGISIRGLILVGAITATLFAVPTSAEAVTPIGCQRLHWSPGTTSCTAHHPRSGEQAWGFIDELAPACAANGAVGCGTSTPEVRAWRWNGSWQASSLWADTQIYVYPYASGWSWAWTQRTGWLAVQDTNVWISSRIYYR